MVAGGGVGMPVQGCAVRHRGWGQACFWLGGGELPPGGPLLPRPFSFQPPLAIFWFFWKVPVLMARPVFGEGSIFNEAVQNIIGLAWLSLKPIGDRFSRAALYLTLRG
jgi:hypothetical protein